jgi:hypothetical protein
MSNWPSINAEPVDPVYAAFRDGVLKANDDLMDVHRWRWSPKHKGWFTYSVKDWILDDVAAADTPAGSFDLIKNDDPMVEQARATLWLPDVFANVQAAYARQQKRWPNLVWSWRGGGDWRNAMSRVKPDPAQPPGGKDPGPVGRIPAECERRIADVRAFAASGHITAAQAQRLIAKIVEECTFATP